MNIRMRKQMEMATRVLVYSREHPSDVAGYQAAVTRLTERLAQADAAGQQQVAQQLLSKGAIAERSELREDISADLRLIAAIATTAGIESVGTPWVIQYPGPRQNNLQFLSGGRVALAHAREQEELLLKYGLASGHLDTLATRLDAFEALVVRRVAATEARVASTGALRDLRRDLLAIVDQLGAINQHRFQGDEQALSAWLYARHPGLALKKVARNAPAEPLSLPPGSTEPPTVK